MPVTVPFSKSTVFKICRQKMCHFRVNGRPIRRIFHPVQNVPASCERSLNENVFFDKITHHLDPKVGKMLVRALYGNREFHVFNSPP